MRITLSLLFLFLKIWLHCQVPIQPNPLIHFDQLIVNGTEIGENPLIQNKRLNSERIVTYVSYVPAFTFGDDYERFDLMMGGSYGKLAIKDNNLNDVYSWNPGGIFNSNQIRILGCYNLDIRSNKIALLVGANESSVLGFGDRFMGVLEFDTTLNLISTQWFSDPFLGVFAHDIIYYKLKSGNYLRYGKFQTGEYAVSEFSPSGQGLRSQILGQVFGGVPGNGGGLTEMPNGTFILNPGFIIDSNYQILSTYFSSNDLNTKYFGSIAPIDTQRFIYGLGSIKSIGNQNLAYIRLALANSNGTEKILFYEESGATQPGQILYNQPGLRAIEATDSNQIVFAYAPTILASNTSNFIIVTSIKLDGAVNWSRSFGNDENYLPLDFSRSSDGRYYLIVAKSYGVAWSDPSGLMFPRTDLMYVTFDTLGNVVSISSDSEPDSRHKIMVYPNPANKVVQIEDFGQYSALKVDLFDITGRKIYNHTSFYKQIDISNMLNGIYFYRITTEDGLFLQAGKLIKTE